jgi:Fic family protein
MVTLFLCTHGGLQRPLLYLSLYPKSNRSDYYRLLQKVRTDGAWKAWLDFFLVGVADTANQAFEAATRIVHEITGRQRGRVFAYQAYLDILNEGTTPPVN